MVLPLVNAGISLAAQTNHLTIKQFRPLAALMVGYACLMLAGGMNSLIIPIRGGQEGFSTLSLGLLGTSWAMGFILGALFVPHLVARVGHIRVFGVMASLATLAVILSVLIIHPIAWIPLRAAAGFCFAGTAMIVEAWVNERTDQHNRGRVFGVYTMVNLTATTTGQMLLVTGDTTGPVFFLIAAIFYTLALIPPALSEQTRPHPLRRVSFDLPALWKNSPSAVVAISVIGISNSAFGALGAVYAQRMNFDITTIATFMSAAILTGAAAQLPVGYFSDRFNRRIVLVCITLVAAGLDIFFLTSSNITTTTILIAGAVFGGTIYSMPPIAMAHANDHAEKDHYLQTSSGMLLLFGAGSIVGPFIAGLLMSYFDSKGLFLVTFCAHLTLIIYVCWRFLQRADVSSEDKTKFARFDPGRVVLQPNCLTEVNFGLHSENNRNYPHLPDRIMHAFDKPASTDEKTELQKTRSGDDTHGGW